ncbi:ABC transporter [Streptomyces eurocidicus]|nr:ABC transporter ATP-binding protein [Streptomyces eurocidicus]MBF6055076.1 ATP-binding cassette domain-containing protein [Streptomyces eurocidicus]PNE34844.1 ABC transporter [Streptomyces eurocidicus]
MTAPTQHPRTAAEPAVLIDSVRKTYGDVHALDGVSLTVHRGEFFGVLGPNGAGKTTLIEIVEGLRRADSGTVRVLGRPPWPRNRELLPRIGVQTQASAFFVRLTAAEHVETVAALYGVGRARAHEALDLVGLTGKARTQVEKLSGGQRQRLAIAAALAHRPDVLFLDEPTAALDPQARRDLWGLLRDLKGQGRTIVCTTHHIDEAEALSDRVAVVKDGTVIALDAPAELIRALGAPTQVLVPTGQLPPDAARGLDGADQVTTEGPYTVVTTRAVGRVLAAVGRVAELQEVRTRTATLEDVYLALTGTEYRT